MKKYKSSFLIIVFSLGLISCSLSLNNPKYDFFQDKKPIARYISISNYSPKEINFRIRISYPWEYLYHVILDEDEERVSEKWMWTRILEFNNYTFKMKAKKGLSFQPEKKYRLCIGYQYPDSVYYLVDHEFMLSEK